MTPETLSDLEFGSQFDQINQDMASFIASRYKKSADIETRFKIWWLSFATFCVERPFDMIYMDQVSTTHLYPKIGTLPSTAFYAETRAIIKEGQESGKIKLNEISLINQFVRLSLTNVIKTNLSAGKTLNQDQVLWIIDACWDGIRQP